MEIRTGDFMLFCWLNTSRLKIYAVKPINSPNGKKNSNNLFYISATFCVVLLFERQIAVVTKLRVS